MNSPTSAGARTDELKRAAIGHIDRITPVLVELSHRIHATPELAFAEYQAVRTLIGVARAEGLTIEPSAYGLETAFAVDFGSSLSPKVAIISEYDALPDVGHACAHNLIAAIGLGAALALHTLIDRLPGSIRYLGAPAEERGCGKELLAREGAFEGVDAAMMVHPASWDLKAVRTACIAEVSVVFTGHASHAAVKPEAGRNALDAAVLSYQAIAQLRQHIRDKERVHGVITEGGGAPNVVLGRAACHYFVRAANARELGDLKARVEACFHGAAQASGCTAEVRWADADYLDMRVNEPLADAYEANATLLGREFTPYEQFPAGGTDMANVSHHVPVLHPTIACAPPDVMIHEPEFAAWAASKRGEQALADGAKALAMTAIDFLQDQTLRRRTQAAFASAHVPAA